ncbi:IS1096 element passenger TnpR family protein [Pedobacter cryophilus]|uniref:Plasmid pRiA4b ORF-3 family protein n=1 Tax=Pedobacter cryophilus TaxID=2571271 RepID=A0A4U1C1G7_9SPHI|nr:plasmid pRiA4b ORF-3 family protein [Pedobacter cryophilus]TKB98814.1 plasmid pRiA4b ORF-3 family protein [Pedobacter cryophilus]
MAVYRFRISFEDYDEVIREIDIKSNQTFKDLHEFFHKMIGYDPEKSSSFYVSNDQWIKNEELAYLPNQRKIERGVALMEDSKLSRFIDDPHQKFYYIYNFDKPFEFHVELIKILDNNPTATYPSLFKSVGEAPKIIIPFFGSPDEITGDEDDLDVLDEMDIALADDEELEGLNTDTEVAEEEEEESDEFMDEFSDTDGFDEEDLEK